MTENSAAGTIVTVKRADELQPGDHIIDVLYDWKELRYIPYIALLVDKEIVEDEVHLTVYRHPDLTVDVEQTVDVEESFHVVTVR